MLLRHLDQALLRRIVEGSGDLIVVEDLSGTYLYYNGAAHYGLAPEDVVGRTLGDFAPPHQAERVRALVRRVFETGTEQTVDLELTWNGTAHWFSYACFPLRDVDGQVHAIAAIARNISAIKEDELELESRVARQQEELGERTAALHQAEFERRTFEIAERTLLDAIPDLAWLKDIDGRFVAVNVPFAYAAGATSPNEIEGKTDVQIWPSDLAQRYQLDDAGVIESGESIRIIEPIAAAGGLRWFETVKVPMRGVDGRVLGTAGVAREVTERLRYEEQLRRYRNELERLVTERTTELERKNQDLLEEIMERRRVERALRETELRSAAAREAGRSGVFELDLGSNELYVDSLIERVLGYEDGEVGHTLEAWLELTHEDDRQNLLSLISGIASGQSPIAEISMRVVGADGAHRWLLARCRALIDTAGRAQVLVGAFTDITDQRRIEEERERLEHQLRHTQKLESLGVLAGGIAHDFNNLLHGILGYARLGLDVLPDDSPAKPLLQLSIVSAEKAADLTRQMLAYSGRGKFVIEPVDLSQLVREMSELLQASITRTATVELDLAAGLPPVEADATQLRQVVMNLIQNASDALGEHTGTIRLRTACRESDEGGPTLVLEITDTGCGMTADVRARMFDPFFTTKFTGRGLGLAAVLGIVRAHHGTIEVKSEPGRGTTMEVLLPASTSVGRERALPMVLPESAASGTVLVVDDEPNVIAIARMTLERAGFSVVGAGDGDECLRLFREQGSRVVAVLLDLTMPRKEGGETFLELRRLAPEARVIISSGFDESEARRRVDFTGPVWFLQKPYGPDKLLLALRRALAG